MTNNQFDAVCRAFSRRRPFRTFHLEFTSGARIEVRHPEAIRTESSLYVLRTFDGANVVFASESIVRVVDRLHETQS
jgi:hypothetical protein